MEIGGRSRLVRVCINRFKTVFMTTGARLVIKLNCQLKLRFYSDSAFEECRHSPDSGHCSFVFYLQSCKFHWILWRPLRWDFIFMGSGNDSCLACKTDFSRSLADSTLCTVYNKSRCVYIFNNNNNNNIFLRQKPLHSYMHISHSRENIQ